MEKTITIKSTKTISEILKNGKRFTNFPIRVIYLGSEEETKVCFIAPKKNLKKAVDRNFTKRILRETYSKSVVNKPLNMNIIFIYLKSEKPNYHKIQNAMDEIFKKIVSKGC